MAESPMVGARVPQDWQQQNQQLAQVSGRKEADIVREALAQYLGRTDVMAVKGAIAKSKSFHARIFLALGMNTILHPNKNL